MSENMKAPTDILQKEVERLTQRLAKAENVIQSLKFEMEHNPERKYSIMVRLTMQEYDASLSAETPSRCDDEEEVEPGCPAVKNLGYHAMMDLNDDMQKCYHCGLKARKS